MSKCKIRKIHVTNWNWGLHLKYTTQMAPQTPQLDVSLENSEPSERSGTQWCTAHGALVSGGHSPKLAVLWCFMVENGNSLSLGHPIFRHTQLDFLMFNKYTHIISLFGQCILAGVFFIPSLLVFVLGENPIWGVAKATTIAQLGVHSADLWGRQVQYPTDLLDGLALRIGNFKKGASLEIGYTGLYRAIPHFDRANDDEAPDFGVADFQTQPFHLGMRCAGARGRAGEKFQGLTGGLGIRRRIWILNPSFLLNH